MLRVSSKLQAHISSCLAMSITMRNRFSSPRILNTCAASFEVIAKPLSSHSSIFLYILLRMMLGQETYLLCSATKQLFDLINFEHLSLRDDFPVHEKRRRGHDSCLSYRGWVCDVFDAHRTVCLRSSSLGVLVELVAALASRAQHRERDRYRPRAAPRSPSRSSSSPSFLPCRISFRKVPFLYPFS